MCPSWQQGGRGIFTVELYRKVRQAYFGRGEAILAERARIKKQTLTHRRLQHHANAA